MPAVTPSKLLAYLEYEQRDKNGVLKSRGRQTLDRHRRTHFIQEDAQGKVIGEVITDKHGNVLEEIPGELSLRTAFKKFVAALKKNKPSGLNLNL